ncbi:ankyrin repeat domain-containing protein [Wolbachia endosymbiont of Encarsia formosa]|uniref:ankyrin repeat domain-containing protein n=1 Tax=Wolbachia endosymbiont of Encarsia formosa TaxID=77125 RepID=UPI0031BB2986
MTLLGIALELDAKEVISCIHKLAKNKGELEKVLNSTSHTLELQNGKILHHTPISWAIRRGNVSQISTILGLARAHGLKKLACSSLFIAIKLCNIVAVSYIIKNFVVPNIIDENTNTPLHTAAACGNTRIVEVLIENDAYVNAGDGIRNTPLHVAAENNNVEIVDALLNRGADVNVKNCHGYAPLHIAVAKNNIVMVDALLNRGADTNIRNDKGYTPLQLSILKGYKGILSCLLEWTRPDINSRLQIGSYCSTTLLSFAAQSRHVGIVELLIEEGADTDVSFHSEVTFLEYCVSERVEMVKTLIALETRLDYFESREELYSLIQSRLSHDLAQQMLEYRGSCLDELERMREKKINKSCTLYDILKSNEANKLASYVRDKNMREELEKAKSEFPIFAERIESQYQKGKERLDLLEQGSSNLHKVFPPKAFLYNILTSEEVNKLASSLREKDMENKLEEAKSEFPILAYLIDSQHKTVTEILDLLEQVSSNLPRVIPAEVSLQIFELLDNIDIKRFNEVINGIEKWIGRAFFMHRGKESSECFSAPNIEEPSNKVREVNIESVNEVVIGRRT